MPTVKTRKKIAAKTRGAKTAVRVKVGGKVRFKFGTSRVTATILEDRGRIGVGGRRFLTVLIPVKGGEGLPLDLPLDEVTLVAPRK